MAKKKAITRKRNEHHETVLCQCGCGQYFEAIYTTRRPRYINAKHKAKANAPTRISKREARTKELMRIRKQARRLALDHIKKFPLSSIPELDADSAFKKMYVSALTLRFERAMRKGAGL